MGGRGAVDERGGSDCWGGVVDLNISVALVRSEKTGKTCLNMS